MSKQFDHHEIEDLVHEYFEYRQNMTDLPDLLVVLSKMGLNVPYLHTPVMVGLNVTLSCNQNCIYCCLLYTSPSPRDLSTSRMPSSA